MRAFHAMSRGAAGGSKFLFNTQALTIRPHARFLSSSKVFIPRSVQPRILSQQSYGAILKEQRSFLTRRVRQTRPNSTNSRPNPDVTPHLGSPEPQLTLSQRMKKLSREYGWTALGVYLALSALDFPFCFLAVRIIGTDRIGEAEHAIVEGFWRAVRVVYPNAGKTEAVTPDGQVALAGSGESVAEPEKWTWGVNEAQEQAKKSNATIWTQLALAYAIHKSFIFIRVPVTAAILPKVVKTLRGWGYNIGKRTPKPSGSPSSKP